MKLRRRWTATVAGILILLAAYVALWSPLEFDSQAWKDPQLALDGRGKYPWPSLRERMLGDLVNNVMFVGMSESEVMARLGAPLPSREPDICSYELGYWFTVSDVSWWPANLRITIRDGAVAEWAVIGIRSGKVYFKGYPPQ